MSGGTLINGEPGGLLDPGDRGLAYGDGLFETLAVVEARAQHWDRHFARLLRGCERLGIPAPDPLCLAQEAASLCAGVPRGVLKLILTRGVGGRGYRPPPQPEPTRILSLHAWPDYPASHREQGVKVRLCSTPLALNRRLAGLKHLNRLEQILARAEWDDDDISEGLMLDTRGRLVEGTMSNLFLVRGSRLLTPDLSEAGVAGIMRELVLEAAAELDIELGVEALRLADLAAADEAFLCNSVIGIWPIREVTGAQARIFPHGALIPRLVARLRARGDLPT